MVNWTADVDAKLFVCALKQISGSLNYGQLAADMGAMGIGTSRLPALPPSPSLLHACLEKVGGRGGEGKESFPPIYRP